MARRLSTNEFDLVLRALNHLPDGGGLDEITQHLEQPVSRRTLQRRLSMLVDQGLIVAQGQGPARRYQLRQPTQEPVQAPALSTESIPAPTPKPAEPEIALSAAGLAIQQSVRAPIQQRHPVGYNREFLDHYQPNRTFYLPLAMRQHLLAIGRSPEPERPAGTHARKILNRLLIDLSWNSSRMEGNTYSLLETERLLQLGEMAEGKAAFEAQMILNHKAAIELLVDQAEEIGFNQFTIFNLHALLSDNLLADAQACGRLRSIPVAIGGTVFQPLEVPQLLEDCFRQMLTTAALIADPFEQAFFIMVQLPYLQPFEDVNKRVSRLAANIPLIRHNFCPLSFVDVPEQLYIAGLLGVYELNRVELLRDVFAWAYQRSCARYSAVRQSLGEPDPYRLRYRALLAEIVGDVVVGKMDQKTADAFIKRRVAAALPEEERARMVEIVELEIMGLHEGNIARYRLRPSQYQAWRERWR